MVALRTISARVSTMRYRWLVPNEGHKARIVMVVLALVYGGIVFAVLPGKVFFSGDLGMKYVLAASMARSGNLWRIAYEYPAQEIDPELRFFPFVWLRIADGRPVPGYITLHMFVNAVLYRFLGGYGLHLIPLLSGLGLAWLAYRLAAMMAAPQPWVAALLVGLCTPMLFYSLTTWEHAAAVCLGTLSLYLMARQAATARWGEAGLAGLAAGLAMWSRREMYLFPVVLVLAYSYVFRARRRKWLALIPFALGLSIVLGLLLAEQQAVYGNTDTGVVAMRTRSIQAVDQGEGVDVGALRALLLNQASLIMHHTVDGSRFWAERVLLALAFVAVVLGYRVEFLRRRPMWMLSNTLLLVVGTGLAFAHSRLSMVVGLIPTLPLTALGVVYPPPALGEARLPRRLTFDLVMTVNVGFLAFGLLLVTHAPGYCWGPRFLAMLFPLMGMLGWRTFCALESASEGKARTAMRVSFGTLVALSLVVQCVGIVQLYGHEREMLRLYHRTRAFDAEYVVSDTRNYLEEMAGLYFDKRLLRAEEQEDYNALVTLLYEHGVRRFAWVPNGDEVDPLVQADTFSVYPVDGVVYEMVAIK
jgi:hypothetical protein